MLPDTSHVLPSTLAVTPAGSTLESAVNFGWSVTSAETTAVYSLSRVSSLPAASYHPSNT